MKLVVKSIEIIPESFTEDHKRYNVTAVEVNPNKKKHRQYTVEVVDITNFYAGQPVRLVLEGDES